jgi:hypothetical protein
MQHWYWILAGAPTATPGTVAFFVAELRETGDHYLGHPVPQATWLVTVDLATLQQRDTVLAPDPSSELFGWSIATDAHHSYLYSNCFRQFGWSWLGHDPGAELVKVARVPAGHFEQPPEYWNGNSWQRNPREAVPILDRTTTGSTVNPAQVIFTGVDYRLILKADDWWGTTITEYHAHAPFGPWLLDRTIEQPLKCDAQICNTYFASWIPWRSTNREPLWAISHNRWDGRPSPVYRPTVHELAAP